MTGDQSRKLIIGARVYWMADRKDAGTVIRADWSSIVVKWDSRAKQTIMHNDMTGVSVG
jgi:hypothetical protein